MLLPRDTSPSTYGRAPDCECPLAGASVLQRQGRCSRWHFAQLGFSSSHLTLRFRQVKQPSQSSQREKRAGRAAGGEPVLWRGTGALTPTPGAIPTRVQDRAQSETGRRKTLLRWGGYGRAARSVVRQDGGGRGVVRLGFEHGSRNHQYYFTVGVLRT